LWRFSPRRLDVESWRDAILAVSERLDRTLGGPATSLGQPDHVRRTVYGIISRREPDKMMVAFDFPDANVSSERRDVTTIPQQQLFVLNSQFMLESAQSLAARLTKASESDEERIALAYRWAFGRRPAPEEVRTGLDFLRSTAEDPGNDGASAWVQFAQAILSANEFAWID
jgi:hypothetical protein